MIMAPARYVVYVALVALCVMAICGAGKVEKRKKKQTKSGKRYSGKCKPNVLAEYEMAFQGGWSERTYPRMYPKYRPIAQWSKLIGKRLLLSSFINLVVVVVCIVVV